MTPKEKALDIVNQFRRIEDERGFRLIRVPYAKECALITVDEIIKEITPKVAMYTYQLQFWEEVKQEINNL